MQNDSNENDELTGEENFAELLEQSMGKTTRLELGEKIEAKINFAN